MPVLKSPEVIVVKTVSGDTTTFSQKTRQLSDNFDTDVGLNDKSGLNVISHVVELQNYPCNNPETSMRMTIRLNEAWADKGAFAEKMKTEHGVTVNCQSNPLCPKHNSITVAGLDNIKKLAEVFRETLFETAHEGATIARQMINPALLGKVVDHAEITVLEYKNRDVTNWSALIPGYGWGS